uniref:Transmembrane protein 161B n=1 Tax=Tanacetum cinerariifolium TaxID=118510 RepID=A0A699L1J5_TANCI|nr:transmembrane protein 161B [Tanacetum cinerariifolium]GFB20823.1 transmembrane protein 161B [Tanacetum cinerariifolium]
MSLFFTSTNYKYNLIIQTSISLILTLLFTLLNIPSFILNGLHTYIHPDDVTPSNPNSNIKAAIRRPGETHGELKPRKKAKERFEFDENKAQIFRLKLNHNHLQSRLYFDQLKGVFSFTIVACVSLLVHTIIPRSSNVSIGVITNGTLIPILLGFLGFVRVLVSVTRVSMDSSGSKSSEMQLSVLVSFVGSLIAFLLVNEVFPNWVVDFEFGSLDGYAKICVSIFMGVLAGVLYVPAAKTARAYWLATDQIRCNLSMIYCGWLGRMLVYVTYLLTLFASLLWISPFADLLVNKNVGVKKVGYTNRLVGDVGMSRSDFEVFRLYCLLATGVLQMLSLRANLQMFLNESVLSWYQRLHASKVPDLTYSRRKVFLHNHYLCLAGIQFFAPSALVLLFLGLSRIEDNVLDHFPALCNLLPGSALVKEMGVFMSWWVVFVSGVFVSTNLVLYRQGVLYVS